MATSPPPVPDRAPAVPAAAPPPAAAVLPRPTTASGPPGPPAPSEGGPAAGGYRRLLGLLRDVSVEAQNLRKRLPALKLSASLADKQTRTRETAAALADAARVFGENCVSIDHRIAAMRALLDGVPDLHDRYGSEVTKAENEWQDVKHEWPAPDATVEDVLRRLESLERHLDELIYTCCLVTVPPRANQHLETLRVGQQLDFHDAFQDELSKAEDRLRLLKFIGAHPAAVHGLVDQDRGVIHYVSPHQWRRLVSYAVLVIAALLGAAVAAGFTHAGEWFAVTDWPVEPAQQRELVVTYFFVVLGAALHFGVDTLKQARAQTGTAPSALHNGLLWVHAKEMPILLGILWLWAGTIGLAITEPGGGWQTAVLVGYSIDSFVDLFLQRFTQFTTTRTERLRAQLETAGAAGGAGTPGSAPRP